LLEQIDRIARELHAIDAGLVRLDPKQIAELARSADVADVDIADRRCEIGVLALARVLAQAANRASAPADNPPYALLRTTCSAPLPSQCPEKAEQRLFLLLGLDIIEDRIGPLGFVRSLRMYASLPPTLFRYLKATKIFSGSDG
jgi:hypothetical protein